MVMDRNLYDNMTTYVLPCQSKCCDGCCTRGAQLKDRCSKGDISKKMYQYVYVEGPWEGTQELFFRHKQTTTLSETTTITKARKPSGIHI